MIIFVFWDIPDYDPNLKNIIEIPVECIKKSSSNEEDIDEIVISYIKQNFKEKIRYWGEFADIVNNFYNLIDEKTMSLYNIIDEIFKNYNINRYYKMDLGIEILYRLQKEMKAFDGVDGIVYKCRNYEDKNEKKK